MSLPCVQALVQTPVLVTLSPTGTTTTTTTSVYQFPSVVLLLDSRESSLDNRPSIPIHSSPPAPCNNIIKTNGLWSEARERVEDEPNREAIEVNNGWRWVLTSHI